MTWIVVFGLLLGLMSLPTDSMWEPDGEYSCSDLSSSIQSITGLEESDLIESPGALKNRSLVIHCKSIMISRGPSLGSVNEKIKVIEMELPNIWAEIKKHHSKSIPIIVVSQSESRGTSNYLTHRIQSELWEQGYLVHKSLAVWNEGNMKNAICDSSLENRAILFVQQKEGKLTSLLCEPSGKEFLL